MQYSGLSATVQGNPKLYTTLVKRHTNTARSCRLHGPRLQRKQTRAAAVQKSQQLAERVPASSVAHEVRFCYFAGCCLFFLAGITLKCCVVIVVLPCAHFRYVGSTSKICLYCLQLSVVMFHVMFDRCSLMDSQASGVVDQPSLPKRIQYIADEFQSMSDPKERYKLLLKYAKTLPALEASKKVPTNRVIGCTSEVWMTASLDDSSRVQFSGDSDSELTRGLCALLVQLMSGLKPQEVLQVCVPPTNPPQHQSI